MFFPRAPTEAHRVRDAARKEMVGIFGKVITERRRAAEQGKREDDFLQTMIDFKYKDTVDKASGKVLKKGVGYTDDEIVGAPPLVSRSPFHTSAPI